MWMKLGVLWFGLSKVDLPPQDLLQSKRESSQTQTVLGGQHAKSLFTEAQIIGILKKWKQGGR